MWRRKTHPPTGEDTKRDSFLPLEELFLKILNSLDIPAMVFSPQKQVFWANEKFFILTGIPFSSVPRWVHEFPLVGKMVTRETEVCKGKDREYVVFSVGYLEKQFFLLKERSQDEKLWEELRFFLTALGHELKTPLTILRGYVQILAGESTHSPEIIEKMQRQVRRFEEILTHLKSLSLLGKRGQMSLREVQGVMDQVIEAWQEEIGKRNLTLSRERVLEGSQDWVIPLVQGDFYLLFSNLFSNAVKFNSLRGVISLRLRTEGGHLVLEVGNHLPQGVSSQELIEKWEYFRKIQALPEKNIGLYLIEKTLRRCDGNLHLFFRQDGGVVFQVSLPLLPGSPP